MNDNFADNATDRVIELRQAEACKSCDEHLQKCCKHESTMQSLRHIDEKEIYAAGLKEGKKQSDDHWNEMIMGFVKEIRAKENL